jgi:hypothetical protein
MILLLLDFLSQVNSSEKDDYVTNREASGSFLGIEKKIHYNLEKVGKY